MFLTGIKLQVLLFFTTSFAFLLFGYDQGVMGSLVDLPSFKNQFGNPSPGLLGFMVASYDIGCLFGAAFAFAFGDHLGRRYTLVISCITLCIGAALQTSAFTVAHYIVGRIVAGLAVGAISVTVPVYASECVESRLRGILLVLQTTVVIMGIVISNFANYGFVFHTPSLDERNAQWRIPLALQLIFPLGVLMAIPWCVESPRWLASRGRYSEVYKTLARLHGKDATPTSEEILRTGQMIVSTAEHEASIQSSWKACFSNGEIQNRRRLIIGAACGIMHQGTGINVVVYYSPVLFSDLGLEKELCSLMSCVGSLCFFIGSALPTLYIERLGRRRTMIMGATLCGTCMGAVACCSGIRESYPEHAKVTGWTASGFIFLFELCFGIGWNSMCWLYGSEVNSLKMRNKGAALQCICNWATNFLSVMTTPIGFATIGWKYYLVWMTITLASIPWLYLCYPETAGRSLEQMDLFFAKYQYWNIRKVAHEFIPFETQLEREGDKDEISSDMIERV